MNYLDRFKPEKINSIPAVRQSLKILKNAIDGREIGNYPPEGGVKFEDLTEELQHSLPKYIETTYSELKSLRDNSQLIPGCWYRITDYECTTIQENTKSAGHKFDILVLATSVNTLSEEAKAIQHEGDCEGVFIDDGDHYVYTGSKVIIHFTDVTKELYLWHLTIDNNVYTGFYSELSLEELKQLTQEQLNEILWIFNDSDTIISENEIETDKIYSPIVWSDLGVIGYSFDSYFSRCNLNAWKIWYSLDNDTSRFVWAKNGLYPAYISTPNILNGEHLEFQGIIYINNNPELNYGTSEQSIRYEGGDDSYAGGFVFRDIENDKSFVGKSIDDIMLAVTEGDVHAVCLCDNEFDESVNIYSENVSEESIVDEGKGVIYRMIDERNNDCPYDFKNIQFIREINNYDTFVHTFALHDLQSDNYVDFSIYNYLKTDDNAIIECRDNKIELCPADGDNHSGRLRLNNNVFFSEYEDIHSPSYAEHYSAVCHNHLGIGCKNNTIGVGGINIVFGSDCYDNEIGDMVFNITFGNKCYNNEIGHESHDITFGDYCYDNSISQICSYIYFESGCNKNLIGQSGVNITLKVQCKSIVFGSSLVSTIKFVKNVTVSNDCAFLIINSVDTTASSANYLQNIHILASVYGTKNSPITISIPDRNLAYETYVGKTTDGTLKLWNPAD